MDNLCRELVKPFLFEIKRKSMPQVSKKEFKDVLQILQDNKISYSTGKVDVSKLKPTQENFYSYKVKNIVEDMKSGKYKENPIFVSQDGYIMDGHHRWKAQVEYGGEHSKISVVKIDLPKWECYSMFKQSAEDVKNEIILTGTQLEEFFNKINLKQIINEASQASHAPVDDGPATFYRNIDHYKKESSVVPLRLGFEILDFLTGDVTDYSSHRYRFNIVPVVSFGSDPDGKKKYFNHIEKVAIRLGYELIKHIGFESDDHSVETDSAEIYHRKKST